VSYVIESALNDGRVDAEVTIPDRNPAEKVLLRFRLPDGRKIASATANGKELAVVSGANGDTMDLSGLKGAVKIRAQVGK